MTHLYLIRPGLEKAIQEKNWESQRQFYRRWIPEPYKEAFDRWLAERSSEVGVAAQAGN